MGIHECDKRLKGSKLAMMFDYTAKRWILFSLFVNVFEPVKFCPYCGIELINEWERIWRNDA